MHRETRDRMAAARANLTAAADHIGGALDGLAALERASSRERVIGIALRDSRDAVRRALMRLDAVTDALDALAAVNRVAVDGTALTPQRRRD